MQISIICGDMYQWPMIEWIQGLWVPLFGHLGPPTAGRRQAVLLAECQRSSPWPQERARHRGLAGLQHIDSLGLAEKLKHMEEICWERTTIVMFFLQQSENIWDVSLWKSDQQNLSAPTRHYRLQDLLDRSPSMLALLQSVIENQQQLDMDMTHIWPILLYLYDSGMTHMIWLIFIASLTPAGCCDQPRLGVA